MATRITSNRLVEDLNNGTKRSSKSNAPAIESENARFGQLNPFRQANVAASQSAVALKLDSDADSLSFIVAGRAGEIVGVAWGLSAAATAGTGSVQCSVGGTAVGTSFSIAGGGTAAVVDQATPVAFVEGAKIGVNITTDSSWLPTTADLAVWVLVRWAA